MAGVPFAAKLIVGLALAAWASLNYGWVFAYTQSPAPIVAMGACFVLLTLPIWLRLFGRPLRRLALYYMIVAMVLLFGALGRFVVEALIASH